MGLPTRLMLKNNLQTLYNTRPYWVTALLGAVAATGFAPLFWWPVTVLCLGLFFRHALNINHAKKGHFFKKSFSFYFGFSVAALWWVGSSFRFTDAGAWGLLAAPFAVLGVAAALSLFVLPALYAAWRLWPKTPLGAKPLLLTFLWVLVEGLRSLTIYGFPWHLLGYTLAGDLFILQAASVGGVWLLSALVVLPAAAYAAKPKVLFTLFWLLPMVAAFLWGAFRTLEVPPLSSMPTPQKVTLIQPNTPQGEKWQISGILTARKVLQTLDEVRAENTLIVFPEVAITMLENNIPNFSQIVGNLVAEGSVAVIGIPREVGGIYLNSMIAINSHGEKLDVFDKQLLVPFGEFVPFRDYLPAFIKQLAQGGDYRGGTGERVLNIGAFGTALPLICYESAFVYTLAKAAKAHKPNMILNLTNDGWFDGTTGGHQHLAIARVRSVELGLPQMRVANTGITAVIDGYGRLEKRSNMRQSSQINHLIPKQVGTIFTKALN